MKRIISLIIITLASVTVAYYYFNSDFSKPKTIETLVPNDAALYYNSDDILKSWDHYKITIFDSLLVDFEVVKKGSVEFQNILSLLPNIKIPLSFSVHKVSKNEFDLVYYFDSDIENVEELLQIIAKKNNWKSSERNLDGIIISEFVFNKKPQLNYCKKDGWLVVSKNSFLIEEVIKKKEESDELKPNSITLFPNNFKQFLSIFFKDNQLYNDLNIEGNEPINFKLNFIDNKVQFIGKSIHNKGEDLKGEVFSFRNYIPIGVSKVIKNNNNYVVYNSDIIFEISKRESINGVRDTLYTEFEKYEIIKYENKFLYNIEGNYFLLTNSKTDLESILTSIENENVWGKSIDYRNFLSNTIVDASTCTYIDVRVYKTDLLRSVSDNYKKEVYAINSKFDFLKNVSFQNLFQNGLVIYEWILTVDEKTKKPIVNEEDEKEVESENLFIHETTIQSKPYLVRNHNSGEREIIFQDSLNIINLVSANGKLLWSKNIEGEILSKIRQIDFYRNGKLQYAFITKNKFYIVDRNGNEIEGYPINFEKNLKFFSVFDYNKDRRYRFLLTFENGDLILKNSENEILEPWSPLNLNSKVAFKPEHYRIGNKDVILVITIDNKVHLLKRKGVEYLGFPYLCSITNIDEYKFNIGSDFAKTSIDLFSLSGEKQKINLKGEISKKQKLKSEGAGDFIYGISDQSFIYAVSDEFKKEIYNSAFVKITDVYDLDGVNINLQYYNLSSSIQLIIVSNGYQNQIFVNNRKVKEIITKDSISCIYSSAKKLITIYYSVGKSIQKLELKY